MWRLGNVEIEWNHPHRVIVRVDGKALQVGGEGLFDRNPDFLIYPSSVTHWEDGSAITAGERGRLLEDLVAEAARRGWKFEIGELSPREPPRRPDQ
jgi:Immunity protein 74